MYGEPDDAEGECNARLFIGDNYGDNTATMRCQLVPGHEGVHKEEFERKGGKVTITWVADERERCDHGCGQWDHAHSDMLIIATASIDGSHGGARSQNGLRASARLAPGHYEIKIAGILPPNAFATARLESNTAVSITTTVVGDRVHVQTLGSNGCAADADFHIDITKPRQCPRDADDHEWSDCAHCQPDAQAVTCPDCGKTTYILESHKRHCAGQPFACTDCGENGRGVHICPKAHEFDSDVVADDFGDTP